MTEVDVAREGGGARSLMHASPSDMPKMCSTHLGPISNHCLRVHQYHIGLDLFSSLLWYVAFSHCLGIRQHDQERWPWHNISPISFNIITESRPLRERHAAARLAA